MLGKQSALVARLKELNPAIFSIHTTAYTPNLCASLGQRYANVIMDVMKTVNVTLLHHLIMSLISLMIFQHVFKMTINKKKTYFEHESMIWECHFWPFRGVINKPLLTSAQTMV